MGEATVSDKLEQNQLFANIKSKEELLNYYDKWCEDYDKDTKGKSFNYVAPALGAKALNGKLKELGRPMDTRILDVASGTGMVGEALKQLGYTNIDGLDGSISSLEFSKKKGVYRNLIRGFLESKDSKDLGVAADQYDAAICIGGFSKYHLKSEALDDLVYVVKPGGIVCFTIRDIVAEDPEYGYNEKMKKLCEEKKWKLVSKFQEEYATAKNIKCWLYIYEIQ